MWPISNAGRDALAARTGFRDLTLFDCEGRPRRRGRGQVPLCPAEVKGGLFALVAPGVRRAAQRVSSGKPRPPCACVCVTNTCSSGFYSLTPI